MTRSASCRIDTQVGLLRVLQEQEFEPVGSSRPARVDVRVIAATNRNLELLVREGRFRSDLYYRLNVFPLTVPPLRDRASDIPQLVTFFLSRFSRKLGKNIEAVAGESMALLKSYSWPGNIRELQNVIERGAVLATGPVLTLSRALFPFRLKRPSTGARSSLHHLRRRNERAETGPSRSTKFSANTSYQSWTKLAG